MRRARREGAAAPKCDTRSARPPLPPLDLRAARGSPERSSGGLPIHARVHALARARCGRSAAGGDERRSASRAVFWRVLRGEGEGEESTAGTAAVVLCCAAMPLHLPCPATLAVVHALPNRAP